MSASSDKVPAGPPDLSYTIVAYIVIVVATGVGWLVWKAVKPPVFVAAQGVSIFACLYIFAQVIERILEPLSSYLDGEKKKAALETLSSAATPENRAAVAKIKRNRAVLLWAIASALAMLASGGLGVFLLRAVGLTGVPAWVDVLVTGLAVGSGTKPLHDLISNLQSSSSSQEASAASTKTA